ncbi:MAG: tetratricopeptide repeat protein [Bacteroidetes bacterium]|nr:tetratricopeptide repeat protein [Bacteroidota bacterium]
MRLSIVAIICFLVSHHCLYAKGVPEKTWKQIDKSPTNELALSRYDSLFKATELDGTDLLRYYIEKGNTCFWLSNYACTNEMAFNALELSEKMGEDSANMRANMLLGNVHYYMKEFDAAVNYYLKAIEIAKNKKFIKSETILIHNLAAVYMDTHKYEEAEKNLLRALRLIEENGWTHESKYPLGKRLLASNYERQKKYKEAAELYKSLLKYAKANNDLNILASTATFYSGLLITLGQGDSAKYYCEEALKIQRKREIIPDIIAGLSFKSLTYSKLNDYKTAYLANQEIIELKDKIFHENLDDRVGEMQVKYQTEKERQAKELAQAQANANAFELEAERAEKNLILLAVTITFLLAAVAFLIYYLRNQKARARLEQKLQLDRLGALIEGEEKERSRIARDLHDGISQLLFGLKLKIQSLRIHDETLLKMLKQAMAEVRNVSHNLAPNDLSELGFVAALKNNVERINSSNQLEVNLKTEELQLLTLTAAQQTNLYRIAQELLNNTLKHAEASHVELVLFKENNKLTFSAKDNGKGFDQKSNSNNVGIGWSNIKARLQLLNGRLNVVSSPGNGTEVFIEIPMAA